ncbi:MAG: hypothetical protein AAF548_03035 [Actinomycetota bacterium]
MHRNRSRWPLAVIITALIAAACSHPIEIVGEGDVVSASGNHDCTYADHQAGSTNCTENTITGAYDETYTAVPKPGWHFHRWGSYCTEGVADTCSFDVSADVVDMFTGGTADPLVAIFRPDVITGYETLMIGHSFFNPFAQGMSFHGPNAGFTDHSQSTVFSGGGTGAPQALWNNASKRATIQGHLDDGDIELFGMTYHPQYPNLTGYINWVDYALAQNPDTRFFIAFPWLPNPSTYNATDFSNFWHGAYETIAFGIVDDLRALYPGVDFFSIPHGQAAVELFTLFDAGQLPDVSVLQGNASNAIFTDNLGHAGDILRELGRLVFLRGIYGVELSTYDYDPGFTTDLLAIADAIMDGHDPAYNIP